MEEEDEIEFEDEAEDESKFESGAWRCIEAEVEAVKTADESEEGRWPLTSIWLSMAQQPRL